MTWMKLDTLVRSNRKLAATITETANANAAWLWLCGNAYCRDALSDGFIPDYMLPTLVPGFTEKMLKPLPAVLVAHRLWYRVEGGYQVHDFLHHNPTKAEVEDKRSKDRARKRSGVGEDSTRNPDGVAADSASHAGESAGARTSPSDSSSAECGSISEIERTSEGGLGETAHHPPLPRRVSVVDRAEALGFVSSLDFERKHGKHALRADLCTKFVCLPESLFEGWLARLINAGTSREQAALDIRAWALDVKARYAGAVPGDDEFKFWRHEWERTHGSNRPSSAARPGAGLDALIGGGRG